MRKVFIDRSFPEFFHKLWLCIGIISTTVTGVHWTINVERGYQQSPKVIPVLLWWTERLYPHFETNETEIQCREGMCMATINREYLNNPNTIALLFYGTDLRVEDMPLPRKPHHEWALFHEESPLNNFLFSHEIGISLFNYTSTFRNLSDYPLTTQFLPSLEYLTERQPVSLEEKNRLRSEEHFAPVLYVQTHCSVPSDRDRYIQELSRYIQIDSYGSCLHNKSLPHHLSNTSMYDDEEFMDFISRYKFHIAFENAICNDYVTEKIYRALHVGSVPVYRGAKTVRSWIPDRTSIILADDFESPKKLAEFISDADADDSKYLSFLRFKTEGISNEQLKNHMLHREWGVNDINRLNFINGFECYICDRVLQRLKAAKKFYSKPNSVADDGHMGCPEPQVSLGSIQDLPSDDEWLQQGWQDDYRYAGALARALDYLVRTGQDSSENIHDVALEYME